MGLVFEKTSYSANEISWEDLEKNQKAYRVISILEHSEHEDILDNVEHHPLSRGRHKELVYGKDPIVFYCQSGLRSSILVNSLMQDSCNIELYSLQGGMDAVESKVL